MRRNKQKSPAVSEEARSETSEEIPKKQCLDAEDYEEQDQILHVLQRPNMYIGDVTPVPRLEWIYAGNVMEKKTIETPRALEKVYLEILTNALDNVVRSRKFGIEPGQIEVSMDDLTVTVRNGGTPIPVVDHKSGMLVSTLIFSRFRSSSNFGENQDGCGQNGIGAKATNIFSQSFRVDIGDAVHKKRCIQTWENNMSVEHPPEVTNYNGESYVSISYTLDFPRFHVSQYTPDDKALFERHAINGAFAHSVPVVFGGVMYTPGVEDFVRLYYGSVKTLFHKVQKTTYTLDLYLLDTPDSSDVTAFVCGTPAKEGVHIVAVYEDLLRLLPRVLGIKKESLTMADLRANISVVMNFNPRKPEFDGQSKTVLTSPKPILGLSQTLLECMREWELASYLSGLVEAKEKRVLSKNDGSKKRRVALKPGAIQANWAGTKRSQECMLFLVEGDSASGYPLIGSSAIPNGRDTVGILPLRGKIPNATNFSAERISKNSEYTEIKRAMGLKTGVDYMIEENYKKLNYGVISILADADFDGAHIAALLINFFSTYFPSLIRRKMIWIFCTPVIRGFLGKRVIKFYNPAQFEKWKAVTPDWSKYTFKYYKGLGSSQEEEILDDFVNKRTVICVYDPNEQVSKDALALAFDKNLTAERKRWISECNRILGIPIDIEELPLSEFINNEFIQHSIANAQRSLPSALDGLKIAQRKLVWAALNEWSVDRDPTKGLKRTLAEKNLQDFASHARGFTSYHHGDKCLADATITMTQSFLGKNNLPFFTGKGIFGTWYRDGEDCADARYLSVAPNWWLSFVYPPEDFPILDYTVEENKTLEPMLAPILPMHLVNGCRGVGTGWSTAILAHNPLTLCDYLSCKLQGKPTPTLIPWYRGFAGKITVTGDKVLTTGLYTSTSKIVTVTELPIGHCGKDYEEWLRSLLGTRLKEYADLCKHNKAHFEIKGFKGSIGTHTLRLESTMSLSNMVLIDAQGKPKKYANVEDILQDFYDYRLNIYSKRRDYHLKQLDQTIHKEQLKVRFLEAVETRELDLADEKVETKMHALGLPLELLGQLRVHSLTKRGVRDHQETIAKLTEEHEVLYKKTPHSLWLDDLARFRVEYLKR